MIWRKAEVIRKEKITCAEASYLEEPWNQVASAEGNIFTYFESSERRERKSGQRKTRFWWISHWKIHFPIGAGGKRSVSWKAKESFKECGEKEKEEKGCVMVISCLWCSGHNTSPSLCSSVELIPPTGPEVGTWPKHGQRAYSILWLY